MCCAVDEQLRQYVLEHVTHEIRAAPAEDTPFSHFVVPGFFPADVYENLLGWLPPADAYEAFSYDKHANQDGRSNRQRYRLENACLDRLAAPQRRFWCSIRGVVGSVEVKRAVFHKLSAGLALRFGCAPSETPDLPGFALPEIFREVDGYHIKPHPDTRKKVVTMQIALARDASQRHLGTELYRRSLSAAAWFREPRGFDTVKTMPFLPNTAYAFVVLNTVRLKSWHGRSRLPVGVGVRNSLLNIWYSKPEQGNQDVIRERQIITTHRQAA